MKKEINDLVNKLRMYNYAYRKGKLLVTDFEYDRNIELLRVLDPNNLFLCSVEPEKFRNRRKICHFSHMLSMEKTYDKNGLKQFVDRVEKKINDFNRFKLMFKLTPKLDGLAGNDSNGVLISRGDGKIGYDISDIFAKGVIPIGGRGMGLGEIVVVKTYFDKYMASYFEHPRNMVAGIVSSEIVNLSTDMALDDKQIHFVPYNCLSQILVSSDDLINRYKSLYVMLVKSIDYPIDGIVVELVGSGLRSFIGATSHHYSWQIAVKIRGETAETIVSGIQWQVGRLGTITPVVEVKPVTISGATIRRVTAHHAGNIFSLKIGIGTRIKIIRSGEVIPKLESVIESVGRVNIPEICVSCNRKLTWDNDFLRCTNDECSARIIKCVVHWFKTLDNAKWFGIKTVKRIVKCGYKSIDAIYNMKFNDLKDIGFGHIQSVNLVNGISKSLSNEVEDWRFLAAFGIPGLGVSDSRRLLSYVNIYNINELKNGVILNIKGFGIGTGELIERGILKASETIYNMLGLGFNLLLTRFSSELIVIDNFFSKKHVVFTGKMSFGSRKQAKSDALRLGIVLQRNVNRLTDCMICGKNPSKIKIRRAKEIGVVIIQESDYLKLFRKIE